MILNTFVALQNLIFTLVLPKFLVTTSIHNEERKIMISTVSLADEPAMFNPSSFMNINFISII